MPTFVFAGGGTGGHLYPGIAIWREIARRAPDARAVFLCSSKAIDADILTREAVDFRPLPAKPFSLRPRAFCRFVSAWGPSVRAARAVLREPCTLVALGGYVAAPAVQAARVEGRRVALVNLDAVPGRANAWIARRADLRLTAADSERVPASWERVPPVVRRTAFAPAPPHDCRRAFDLHPDRPTLLVTGGSLGAASLNSLILELLRRHPEDFHARQWQVLHQTGARETAPVEHAYDEARVPARVVEFISDMGRAWGAATLAVARCGAGTVGEAWANAVPALFLPYPFHRDQHQKFNAHPLERCAGAIVEHDLIDPANNIAHAGPRLLRLLREPGEVESMRARLRALGPADGAEKVAARLLAMVPAR